MSTSDTVDAVLPVAAQAEGAEVLRTLSRQGRRDSRRERSPSIDRPRRRTPRSGRCPGRLRHVPHRATDALDTLTPTAAPVAAGLWGGRALGKKSKKRM